MKNKKGLGSIPKSLAWINSSEPIVPESKPIKKISIEKVQEHAPTKPTKVINDQPQSSGRINPQLSCTITPEDKELLNELALYMCNRERKVLNTSVLIRALIRLGKKYKEELSF